MFKRIRLPYEYADLEPAIGRDTVEVHYDGHYKTYTEKFNSLIADLSQFADMDPQQILLHLDKAPADKRQAIKNNGGGFYIHGLYFNSLTPEPNHPHGRLLDKINSKFGSYDAMKAKMHEAATATLFGSGWAWLVEIDGNLDVTISANQDLPEKFDNLLLPLDMWEHAYYLNYKNKKADYATHFFDIVDWEKVIARLKN